MGKRKKTRLIIKKVTIPNGRTVTEAGVYNEADSGDIPIFMMRLQVSPGIEVKEGESLTLHAEQILVEGKTVAAGIALAKISEAASCSKGKVVRLLSKRTCRRTQAKANRRR